jgi:hypothetical protein
MLVRIHQRHLVDRPAESITQPGLSGQGGGYSSGEKGSAVHKTGP